MEINERLKEIDQEIGLLKVEIRTVLVDIRDELLKRSGPFAGPMGAADALYAPGSTAPAAPAFTAGEPSVQSVDEDRPARSEFTLPAPDRTSTASGAPGGTERRGADRAFAGGGQQKEAPAMSVAGREWGVLDIASLGKWAEAATKRVGRKRLEELLGVYELLTGEPAPATRQALLRMLDICGATAEPPDVSMNDVLAVLSQLDALFRSSSIAELTVLSLLSEAA